MIIFICASQFKLQICLSNTQLQFKSNQMLVFGRGENRGTRKKPLGAEKRTNNKLSPLMTLMSPGIEHWRKASILTTAPTLLPILKLVKC